MVLLSSSDKIQIVLDSNVVSAQLQAIIRYDDKSKTIASLTQIEQRNIVETNNTTDVDLLTGPTISNIQRIVTFLNIYNSDTADAIITIKYNNGTSNYIIYKKLIPKGKSIQYTISSGFFLTDKIGESIDNIFNTFNGTFDAFYRQRFSEPTTLFDSKQLNDKQPLFWDDQLISGSGGASTYNTNQASTTLSVPNLTACVRARQTFRHFNYQPGKSQLIIQTGVWGNSAVGIKRKAGMYNSKNGIFFDQQSDGMGVTIRTYTSGSAVDTRILQSSWNIDKLDGTGTSRVNLDFTKGQVWFIDFEWLGTGDVALGFFVGRKPIYCHVIYNANIKNLVWMSTPNLPLRYEIENTGSGSAEGFTQICSTVISEGGIQQTGFPFGVSRGATALTTNNDTNIYPLIALRLNNNYLGSTIKLSDFNITCTSTATFNYYLILNPTIVGTALSFTPITNSSIDAQTNTVNTTTITGGTILYSGNTSQTNEGGTKDLLKSDFSLGSNIAGTADIVVLAVQRITGALETFYASINWIDQQ